VRGDGYLAFVDEFVAAVQQLYPKCCIQWEDFANLNAVPILAHYRDTICTFNDDIQGTAGVALAGIFAALRLTGQKSPISVSCFLAPAPLQPAVPG
jgi:malate dehydrogenase (oxaloacetate-decarboxylating)(NADP+)